MIKSMTGYGKAEAMIEGRKYAVEIRSLNHRYLEISLRLPGSLSALEMEIKRRIGERFSRGRIEVAIDRFRRGYASNITEVLFFLDVWSLGLDKAKFYEIDNASRQVISYVKLRRTPKGCIDRIDLRDRYYEFTVDDNGVVTGIVHPLNAHP